MDAKDLDVSVKGEMKSLWLLRMDVSSSPGQLP